MNLIVFGPTINFGSVTFCKGPETSNVGKSKDRKSQWDFTIPDDIKPLHLDLFSTLLKAFMSQCGKISEFIYFSCPHCTLDTVIRRTQLLFATGIERGIHNFKSWNINH